MHSADKTLENLINKRKEDGNFRVLTTSHNSIDFCSNDYLGFSKSFDLKDRVFKFSRNLDSIAYIGSTGSRLISGNTALIESLESFVATYHYAEAGLIFNSGYDANVGLLSSVPQRGDTIFYDESCHASIRDGVRLSFAKAYAFRHNDVDHLKKRFDLARGNVYVVVEAVYSMDGDFAPLKEISDLCISKNANLIVDEAHSSGVFGNGGKGLVADMELTSKVFARVHTFGKALGCHGAIVLGSNLLRTYLLNYARTFIYTTAMPFHSYIAIKSAYDLLNEDEECLTDLHNNIAFFKQLVSQLPGNPAIKYIESSSAIQCFIIQGNENVKKTAQTLNRNGYDIKPILSPTVPKGKERIRICIHSFNTKDEISALVKAIANTTF